MKSIAELIERGAFLAELIERFRDVSNGYDNNRNAGNICKTPT
jgi:hypothetical protein